MKRSKSSTSDIRENRLKREKVAKTIRDAQRLKEKARYIIVLDEKTRVVNFIHNESFFANLIAVLAPSVVEGVYVSETLVLEIGISRSRPYKTHEKTAQEGSGKAVQKFIMRTKVRNITEGEFVSSWKFIESSLSSATFQARRKWKVKDPWWTPAGSRYRPFERGVYFSVSKDDQLLHEHIQSEDLRTRLRYIKRNASIIHRWVRRLKYIDYPVKQFRGFRNVQKAIELWRQITLEGCFAELVMQHLPALTQMKFRNALHAFGLPEISGDLKEKVRMQEKRNISFLKNSQIRIVRHKGVVHGKDCVVFEHFFKESFRVERNL